MSTPLAALGPGQSCIVEGYAEINDIAQRLMQMGVIEGTAIEIVRFAPAGDPIEIRLMGYSLSLRNEEAANVLVGAVR
jgi:ferrous iron transport protein A